MMMKFIESNQRIFGKTQSKDICQTISFLGSITSSWKKYLWISHGWVFMCSGASLVLHSFNQHLVFLFATWQDWGKLVPMMSAWQYTHHSWVDDDRIPYDRISKETRLISSSGGRQEKEGKSTTAFREHFLKMQNLILNQQVHNVSIK